MTQFFVFYVTSWIKENITFVIKLYQSSFVIVKQFGSIDKLFTIRIRRYICG